MSMPRELIRKILVDVPLHSIIDHWNFKLFSKDYAVWCNILKQNFIGETNKTLWKRIIQFYTDNIKNNDYLFFTNYDDRQSAIKVISTRNKDCFKYCSLNVNFMSDEYSIITFNGKPLFIKGNMIKDKRLFFLDVKNRYYLNFLNDDGSIYGKYNWNRVAVYHNIKPGLNYSNTSNIFFNKFKNFNSAPFLYEVLLGSFITVYIFKNYDHVIIYNTDAEEIYAVKYKFKNPPKICFAYVNGIEKEVFIIAPNSISIINFRCPTYRNVINVKSISGYNFIDAFVFIDMFLVILDRKNVCLFSLRLMKPVLFLVKNCRLVYGTYIKNDIRHIVYRKTENCKKFTILMIRTIKK